MALFKRRRTPSPGAARLPLVKAPPTLAEPAQVDHLLEQYKVFVETEEPWSLAVKRRTAFSSRSMPWS